MKCTVKQWKKVTHFSIRCFLWRFLQEELIPSSPSPPHGCLVASMIRVNENEFWVTYCGHTCRKQIWRNLFVRCFICILDYICVYYIIYVLYIICRNVLNNKFSMICTYARRVLHKTEMSSKINLVVKLFWKLLLIQCVNLQ